MTDVAYIALGSNVGNRSAHLAAARARIAALAGVQIVASSEVEETVPVGYTEQPPFLNQMIAVRTTYSPRALLQLLLEIERAGGRARTAQRWGPRTIDLDIVAYDAATVAEPDLIVPHPELPNREFWQRELEAVRTRLHA